MSRKPGEGEGTYRHPKTISAFQARRLSDLSIRDGQSFALVRDGKRWQVWAPIEDEARIVALIEQAREL